MAPDRGSLQVKKDASRAWSAISPPLSDWILDGLSAMSFTKMTPVQASTIPLFMGHKDVVVEAVTGSGKTLAFLIPIVERILRLEEQPKKHHVAAIVMSPTRELATQIYQVLLSLLNFHGPSSSNLKRLRRKLEDQEDLEPEDEQPDYPADAPKVVPQLLVGGSSTAAQDLSKFLKTSSNMLISTPGRLLEILSSPHVHCPQSSFEVLVLDEADRLLDLGFKDDITKILAFLPKQRRTGLFSASVSEAVDQIIRVGLRNPVRISVKVKGANGALDKKTPVSLRMTYVVAQASHKLPTFSRIMNDLTPRPLRTIVYFSTCAAVDYFQSLIPSILPSEFQMVPLHGKHPSNVREKNFTRFVTSTSPVILLTTDVAARGLDVPEVDLVIQIDPPSDPKAFLHRCGRAGRAGRKGLSIVFLQPGHEEEYVSFLDVRKTPIEQYELPGERPTQEEAEATTKLMQDLVLKDRAIHDKAQKAFVSWVRSYSKHQASSIFRMVDQDWADLAAGWALLRMPKMPELKSWDRSLFEPPEVAWDTYKYMDKQREKQRQSDLRDETKMVQEQNRAKENNKRSLTQAWSAKVEQKASKATKRSKKEAKREFERQANLSEKQRADEAETEKMIQAIRRQNLRKEKDDLDFEGFE